MKEALTKVTVADEGGSDVNKIPAWAKGAVAALYELGIIEAKDEEIINMHLVPILRELRLVPFNLIITQVGVKGIDSLTFQKDFTIAQVDDIQIRSPP